ncbi:hypothetical protein K7432_003525 [Basidiobolus ranarum]|uniref:G-protein coupled receptors family 1 profile domain-containing protein n=1 Tax=Basidiobolus ranarum TaxID=34480 RepID=A0ABR2W6J7_9FUNG
MEGAFSLSSLIGSSLSTIASLLLILCYILLPSCRTYRHRLILSLSIADFSNSLNNVVSGVKQYKEGSLQPDIFCTANGFIGQLTVQAQDFSTLLTAIVTFVAISKPLEWLHSSNFLQIYEPWLYLCIWGVSLTTSLVGLFTVGYVPVSGNWCWLPPYPVWVRYALTHGFRFMIIPLVFFFYIRLFILLRKSNPATNDLPTDNTHLTLREIELAEHSLLSIDASDLHDNSVTSDSSSKHRFKALLIKIGLKKENKFTSIIRRTPNDERRITRVMLKMCLYPMMYTICWLPGILNRLLEMGGGHSNVLTNLQAATQFIGFFDALLYGYTENLKQEIQRRRTEMNS